LHHAETLVFRELALQVPAERFRVKGVKDGNHHIAADIIITKPVIVEDTMGIDEFGPFPPDAVYFCGTFHLIDVVKHDPPRRREEKFKFGELAPEERSKIVEAQGFVVEKKKPRRGENGDERIPGFD
jgi:hypothetical protein